MPSGVVLKSFADADRVPLRDNRGTMYRLIGPDDGARNVDVHINEIDAGARPRKPLHYHADAESIYMVLEGVAEAIVGDDTFVLHPNEVLFIPPGVYHAPGSAGDGPVRLLEIYAPPGADFHFAPRNAVKGAP